MPVAEAPRAVKQHAVPQNILQVEFKVIGDLTMRQFFYLLIGAVFAAGFYKSGLPGAIAIPLALASALAAVAVAFIPIEERGMDEWVVSFFSAIYQPTQRIWRKEEELPKYFLYQNAALLKTEMLAVAPTASRRRLEEYLERETGEKGPADFIDQKEAEYVRKVSEAFSSVKTRVKTEPKTGITRYTSRPWVVTTPTQVEERPVAGPKKETPEPPEQRKEQKPGVLQTPNLPEDELKIPTPEEIGGPKVEEPTPQAASPQIMKPSETTLSGVDVKTRREKITYRPYNSITPDRLSGRRFSQLTPTQGEIILPIRGERIIRTSEEVKASEVDLNEKANQLMAFVEKIKRDQEQAKSIKAVMPKIEEPKASPAPQTPPPQKPQAPQPQTTTQVRPEPPKPEAREEPVAPQAAIFAKEASLAAAPNLINGFVKDREGKLVEGAVVLIKDAKGDVVRALKTNKLGQFLITTPVTNGRYNIEVTLPSEESPTTFDTVAIEVKGEVLPPVEFTGKL